MLSESLQIDQAGPVVTCRMATQTVSHATFEEAVGDCEKRLRCDGARRFVFDLTGVNYLASACIGALVSFMQDVEHIRGQIALVGCGDDVRFLFRVTKLDDVFPIYDDAQEAIDEMEEDDDQ